MPHSPTGGASNSNKPEPQSVLKSNVNSSANHSKPTAWSTICIDMTKNKFITKVLNVMIQRSDQSDNTVYLSCF